MSDPEHLQSASQPEESEESQEEDADCDEELTMPDVPVDSLSKDERKKLLTGKRRAATRKIAEIEGWRKVDEVHRDIDELRWCLKEAETLAVEIKKLQLGDGCSKSSHLKSLQKAIGVGGMCAERWASEANICTNNNQSAGHPSASSTSTVPYAYSPTLPPPKIPMFSGDGRITWPEFWSSFSAVIESNPHISRADKLGRLFGYLEGKARKAVQGIIAIDKNYDPVVQTLKDRFFDRDKKVKDLVDTLNDLPSMDNLRPSVLVDRIDDLLGVVRQLETLCEANEYEFTLGRIVKALPRPWRERWERSNAKKRQTFQDLVEFINEERRIKEICDEDKPRNTQPPVPKIDRRPQANSHNGRRPFTTSALRVSQQPRVVNPQVDSPGIGRRRCLGCAGRPHPLSRCFSFLRLTPEERKQKIIGSHICMNCLGPHSLVSCKSQMNCLNCQQRHHTLLCTQHALPTANQPCPSVSSRRVSSLQSTSAMGGDTSVANSQSNGSLPCEPVHAHCLPSTIYSMGAISKAWGPQGFKHVRVLFDSGSDISFIREDIAAGLALPIQHRARFACVGVMGRSEQIRDYFQVSCHLQSLQNERPIPCKFWVMANLCAPLKPRQVPYHHNLRGVFIADDFSPGPVDIIIGTDMFYSFVKQGSISLSSSLRALETELGWVIHGKGVGPEPTNLWQQITSISVCKASLSHFWEIEGLGIDIQQEEIRDVAKPHFDHEEGKVVVGLLWKDDSRPVSNLPACKTRLEKMVNRLSPTAQRSYEDYMKEKLNEGKIRRSSDEWSHNSNQFFLPHRCILDKKFRVVFDASARDGRGMPLNSYLHSGPNLLPLLLDVLIRFRTGAYAIQGDCKSAFHQIKVPEVDQPFLQFLWKSETFAWRFLPFGLTCSPYNLHVAVDFILEREEKDYPDLVSRLREGFYVDDISGSFDTKEQALKAIEAAIDIFGRGGLTLHKTRVSGDEGLPQSILGLIWNSQTDEISVELTAKFEMPTTRRTLQSVVGGIWDPLGFLAPWVLSGKLSIQESFVVGGGWDDPLPVETQSRVDVFVQEFIHNDQQRIALPRCVSDGAFILEVYCDASKIAFAGVAYALCMETGDRILITAKSRLAPVKQRLTIPRMELMAALIGSRLATTIRIALKSRSETKPTAVRFFSDSMDVLYWLQRKKPQKVFVKNRVNEILQHSSVEEWYYVSTDRNPADLATRPCSLEKLMTNDLWWKGSTFEDDLIPFCQISTIQLNAAVEEEEEAESSSAQVLTLRLVKDADELVPISIKCFSSLKTLIRVTAYVFRFIRRARKKFLIFEDEGMGGEGLTFSELNGAKEKLIRMVQEQHFEGNSRLLAQYQRLHPSCGEDGLYRIHPRNGETPKILLPPKSYLTKLIIEDCHKQSFHMGVTATASVLSSKYHVGRGIVKDVVKKCRICIRYRSLPYKGPEGRLPDFRSNFARAFTSTGVDYFGPLLLEGKRTYVLLFTCATTRNVHLELVESQSFDDTSLALRRFLALRGKPALLYSDNARTFKQLARVVGGEIEWRFIPERSPWWGGFWERLVGVTKRCLKTTLHGSNLDFKTTVTILYELSLFINMRPLVSFEDSNVLTPAHFLFGVPEVSYILCPRPEEDQTLYKKWKYRQRVADDLKKRWEQEYLIQLRIWRQKDKGHPVRLPSPGDVVLVHSDKPRQHWRKAVVESLIVGPDGGVRAAKVRIGELETRRALERLYFLEACQPNDDTRSETMPEKDKKFNRVTPEPIQVSPEEEDNINEPASPSYEPERLTRRGRQIKRPARFCN